MSLNDGSEEQRTLSGTPDYRLFKTVERNVDPVVDLPVPLQYVRYIEVKQLVRGEWEIDEFEIFGEGFASAAQYTSNVFNQGAPGGVRPRNLGKRHNRGTDQGRGVPWRPAAAAPRCRPTPPGADGLPHIPRESRTGLPPRRPTSNWQFQLNFASSDILSAATVDSIAVEVAPALADSLLGEIWPQNAMIGQATELAYTVRSFNSLGFDRLHIETQAPVEAVSSVSINGSEVEFEKFDIDGGVEIRFPQCIREQRPESRLRKYRPAVQHRFFPGGFSTVRGRRTSRRRSGREMRPTMSLPSGTTCRSRS